MAEQKTQLASRAIVRYSNQESKRITRECIETALIQLLEKEEFEKISISEIVKRAGVSRTAFYRNYESREDVLQQAVTDAISGIVSALTYDSHSEQFWFTLFTAAEHYLRPFQLLLKAGMGDTILNQITAHMLSQNENMSLQEQYNEILWAGAIYNILVRWVQKDDREPAGEIARMCQKCCL